MINDFAVGVQEICQTRDPRARKPSEHILRDAFHPRSGNTDNTYAPVTRGCGWSDDRVGHVRQVNGGSRVMPLGLYLRSGLLDISSDMPLLGDGKQVVYHPVKDEARGEKGKKHGEDEW